MDDRERRIYANEALFRRVNDEVRELNRHSFGTQQTEEMTIVCECGTQECIEQIELSVVEYEGVRCNPGDFVVKPDHAITDVEEVVFRRRRYWVVRKPLMAEARPEAQQG